MTTETTLTILNKKGLHARAAAKFVKAVESFHAEVHVTKLASPEDADIVDDSEYVTVSGKSILGLLMLAAEQGTSLHVSAAGPSANEVLTALRDLIENKFGEE